MKNIRTWLLYCLDETGLLVISRNMKVFFCKVAKATAERHASAFRRGMRGGAQRAVDFNQADFNLPAVTLLLAASTYGATYCSPALGSLFCL